MKTYNPRKSSKLKKIALIFVAVVLVLAIGTFCAAQAYYSKNLQPISESRDSSLFEVKKGATASEIAADLEDAKLIRSAKVFEVYARLHNVRSTLQAGSYYLRPSMSVQEIVGVITQGKVATDLLTILPGKRIDQVEQAFIKAGYSQTEVTAAFQADQYRDLPVLADLPKGANLEGYLFPDSYQKTTNTKADVIVRQSLELMQKTLTADVRAGFAKQGLSVQQGITMASIVEKEVSHSSDRATVAQVFLLRYKQGISLGSDVTALYGAIHDGLTLPADSAAATSIALNHDSPYNTRAHAGMPPGPISNVSASSLKAVAAPSQTDYLFFVAGDDGTTYFAHTVQEHEANAQAYCHKLCGRP